MSENERDEYGFSGTARKLLDALINGHHWHGKQEEAHAILADFTGICESALESALAESQERTREWALALQSLTPGGSEYADDPAACATCWQRRKS